MRGRCRSIQSSTEASISPRLRDRKSILSCSKSRARPAGGRARNTGRRGADAGGGDPEQLDAHRPGKIILFDLLPQLVEAEQPFGDEEGGDDLLERGAFLLSEVERAPRTETIDEPVRD